MYFQESVWNKEIEETLFFKISLYFISYLNPSIDLATILILGKFKVRNEGLQQPRSQFPRSCLEKITRSHLVPVGVSSKRA